MSEVEGRVLKIATGVGWLVMYGRLEMWPSMEIFRWENATEEAKKVDVYFREGSPVSRAVRKELTSGACPNTIILSMQRPYKGSKKGR